MVRLSGILLIIPLLCGCNSRRPAISETHTAINHTDTAANYQTAPLQILTYGLPMFSKIKAQYAVAKKYGFGYHAVTGCVVTKSFVDSINRHNDSVYAILESRYGKDWRNNFTKEVEQTFAAEKK